MVTIAPADLVPLRWAADVDALRWPHTSAFLYCHEKEQQALTASQGFLAFAYRAMLAKAEHHLMQRVG